MTTVDDHHNETTFHSFRIPVDGAERVIDSEGAVHDWGDDFDYNFEYLDDFLIVRGTSVERGNATGMPAGLIWLETDNDALYHYDGSSWSALGGGGGGGGGAADTLDGYEGADFAVRAENESIPGSWTFSGAQTFNGATTFGADIATGIYTITGASATDQYITKRLPAGAGGGNTGIHWNDTNDQFHFYIDSNSLAFVDANGFTFDNERVPAVKDCPNFHLPGTNLDASGGDDTATGMVHVPANKTLHLWGWGCVDETGNTPSDMELYLRSGDLTGTPVTEHSDLTPSEWEAGAGASGSSMGSSLATVAGGTAGVTCYLQMVNAGIANVSNVGMVASYTIEAT